MDKHAERNFHKLHGHERIKARAVGAFVKNTVYRQRICILNAGCKVALACDGNNESGTLLHHNAARYGAARGHCQRHTVMIAQGYQVAYGA